MDSFKIFNLLLVKLKNWRRFLITVLLSLSLTLGFNLDLTAQVSPSQLVQQAQQQYQRGNSVGAIALLKQAEQIYRSQEQTLQQAQVLALISLSQQQLGNWQLARANLDNSLTLISSIPASSSKTQVLAQISNTQAHYLLDTGQYNEALANWQQAEQLYRQIKDRPGISGTLLDQAQALEKMGFYRRACDRIFIAFEQPDYSCSRLTKSQISTVIQRATMEAQPWQVDGLNSIGNSLLLMGKLSLAERFIQASHSIHSSLLSDSPTTKAKILLSLGNINKAIALRSKEQEDLASFTTHSQKAIQYYQQLEAQTSTPMTNAEQLSAQLNQLSLAIVAQKWPQAKTLAAKIRLTQDFQRNLYAEVKFAHSLELLKQHNISLKYSWQDIVDIYLDAIAQARLTGNRAVESYALGYLGTLCHSQNISLNLTAQQLLEQALVLAQTLPAPEIAYRWQWQLGKMYRQRGQRIKAIASYQAALANLSDLRSDLVALAREVQFDFQAQIEPVYRELVDLLLAAEFPSAQDLEMARNVIEALQVAELDNYFQDACTTFEPKSIDQIDSEAAIIYTVILPERLEIIMATSDSQPNPHQVFHHHTQVVSKSELESTIKQLRQYITEPDRTQEVQQLAAQIYTWLIKPLIADLRVKQPKTLVFVLDGLLQTIPMSVLYDGEQYLIEKYAIALTPGLRLLNPQIDSSSSSLLAGGVSKFLQVRNHSFSALTNVPEELNTFNELDSQVLLNEQFTPANLLEQLNTTSASIVHLATHGQFRSNPEQTFLLMWQKLLTIQEFSSLLQSRAKAVANPLDLLVLSACNTATGDRQAALGLAGVAVRSGSVSTLATLWQINDDSTTALMKHFYQQFDHHNKAEALRQAQLKLWQTADKDWRVPAFWSAYIMIGNWQ
ncbi:MAG: CHAT domain-containing protein [Pleurocapsa sp.]